MSQRLRLGWIGAGTFAQWGLLPGVRDCTAIELVAVCDREAGRACQAAERFGAQRWYTDTEILLRDEALDAVAVIGPPAMALELATSCLERGLPVYVEKPLGRNAHEAQQLANTAARYSTTGQVGFNWRHAPVMDQAQALIRAPEFGRPTYLESHHHEPGGCQRIWDCADEVQSFLLLHGVHAVDQLRFQFGEVSEVFSRVTRSGPTLVLTSSVSFVNGATGWLALHGGYPHTDASILAVGDCLSSVWAFNFEHLEYRRAREQLYAPAGLRAGPMGYEWRANFTENRPERMGYRQELQRFAEALLAGREPSPSLADAVRTMQLCDAVYQSAIAGEAVRITPD